MVARGKNKEISKDDLIIDWSDVNILEFPNKSRYEGARSSRSVGQYERPDLQKVFQKFPNLDQNDHDHDHKKDIQVIIPVRAKTSPIGHLPLPYVPHIQVHVLIIFIPNLPFPILHNLHFRILFTKI
jgi:hypothetical protein